MKTRISALAGLMLLVTAGGANAALVTLQADYYLYRQNEFNDALFTLTFDDSTPDSNPDPLHGHYDDSIVSAEIVLDDGRQFSLDPTVGTYIGIGPKKFGGNVNIFATFLEAGSNIPWDLLVSIETWRLTNDGLRSLIGAQLDDSCASRFYPSGNSGGRFCERSAYNLVPVPPAMWLFGSALGLMGWMRRKAIA